MLRALLDRPAAQAATLPRARALAAAAHLLMHTGGYALSGDYCREALAVRGYQHVGIDDGRVGFRHILVVPELFAPKSPVTLPSGRSAASGTTA